MNTTLKNWIIATRPWSFPASLMPALVAFSYVFYLHSGDSGMSINWWFGALAMLGAVIFQASGNLISDYYDFNYQVDRKESFGSSRMLVDGVFSPRTILNYGFVLLTIASLLGLYLLFNTGWHLLWIGILGILGTVFYYKLKYIALGDFLIYSMYGMLIGLGTSFSMTNMLLWNVLFVTMPIGFLVVNILHANNTRDIKHDGQANIKTQAMLLGIKYSKIQYTVLAVGAYAVVLALVLFGILHPLCLAVFVTLPLAGRNIKQMKSAEIEKPENIKNLDGSSAQLVMIFGLLLTLSNIIAVWL